MQTDLFDQVPFCVGLPRAALQALETIAIPLEHPAGSLILLEGDPAEAMFIVLEGRVKIYRMSATGREQILQIAGAGAHFNTVAIFDHGPCPANVEALSHVSLVALPSRALLGVIEAYPMIACALLREMSSKLRYLVDLVDKLALHTVQGRLAGLLLEKAEARERGAGHETITQAQMAAQLGTVREMVARTLKNFESLGLISVERGAITIVDREGLVKQCEI